MVGSMSTTLDEIAKQALKLSAEQRAQLADLLEESLETAPPDQIRKLWVEEALRRRDEVRSGRVKPVPGEEVMAEARRLAKR